MKLIQRTTTDKLRPFRKLAVAGCLVAALGCGSANQAVVPDYWGARHTESSHSRGRLTSLFREKAVEVAGAKVSFVIPNDSLSGLEEATKRHKLNEEREGKLYASHAVIKRVPFGSRDGERVWSDLGVTYGVEKGTDHAFVISFDRELDTVDSGDLTGTKVSQLSDFPAILEKVTGNKMKRAKILVETVGIPTTAFAIPLNEDGTEMGQGPWGQLAAGMSFNPGSLELVSRIVVLVPEGKTRDEARDALTQKLGSP